MGRPSWDEIENTLAPLFRHKEPRWDEVIASLVPFLAEKYVLIGMGSLWE